LTVTVEKTRHVNAPPSAVWKALADFAAIAEWAPNCDHSSWAGERREGPGTVRRVQAGRITLLETVTEWQPDQSLAYQLTGLPPQAGTVTNRWQLEPAGTGTHATLTTTIEPLPGPPGAIVSRVLGRQLARADERMLTGLAHRLESPERRR
jgi:uncharacterized protein YndB with AHSA1/START domain